MPDSRAGGADWAEVICGSSCCGALSPPAFAKKKRTNLLPAIDYRDATTAIYENQAATARPRGRRRGAIGSHLAEQLAGIEQIARAPISVYTLATSVKAYN